MSAIEKLHLKFLFERFPIATNHPVEGDNRLEYPAVIVGFMPMFLWQNDVATLVANQILIVRRNQQEFAFAEASRAAIVGEVKVPAFPCFLVNRVAQQFHSLAAIVDVQTRPPNEILQRGRLPTLEVFAGQKHQGLISIHFG